jgi:hypothetical protein
MGCPGQVVAVQTSPRQTRPGPQEPLPVVLAEPLLAPPLDEPPTIVLELVAELLPLGLEARVEGDEPVDPEDVALALEDPLEPPLLALSAVGWTQHPDDRARMPATMVFAPRMPTSAKHGSRPGRRGEDNLRWEREVFCRQLRLSETTSPSSGLPELFAGRHEVAIARPETLLEDAMLRISGTELGRPRVPPPMLICIGALGALGCASTDISGTYQGNASYSASLTAPDGGGLSGAEAETVVVTNGSNSSISLNLGTGCVLTATQRQQVTAEDSWEAGDTFVFTSNDVTSGQACTAPIAGGTVTFDVSQGEAVANAGGTITLTLGGAISSESSSSAAAGYFVFQFSGAIPST